MPHECIWKHFHQDKTEIKWLPKWSAYLNPCRAECMQNHNKSFLVSASRRTESRSHCIKQSVSVLHHLSYWGMCLVYPIYRLPAHQGPSISLFTLHYIFICTACKALPFQIHIENSVLRDANPQLKLHLFIHFGWFLTRSFVDPLQERASDARRVITNSHPVPTNMPFHGASDWSQSACVHI